MASNNSQQPTLGIAVPEELLDSIAERVAARLEASDRQRQAEPSPWLDFEGACAYLGFSRDQLYKLTGARAVPMRKKAGGQGLRFHRDELDAWMQTAYPRLDRLPIAELSSPVSLENRQGRR